jgi:hypothetical protein
MSLLPVSGRLMLLSCTALLPTGEHTDHTHFHCLMMKGYPGRCSDACFIVPLIRNLVRQGNCWTVAPRFGRCTGWIIDYDYLTGIHTVLFDTGVEARLEFCGGP